jgi:hypothetical protein
MVPGRGAPEAEAAGRFRGLEGEEASAWSAASEESEASAGSAVGVGAGEGEGGEAFEPVQRRKRLATLAMRPGFFSMVT